MTDTELSRYRDGNRLEITTAKQRQAENQAAQKERRLDIVDIESVPVLDAKLDKLKSDREKMMLSGNDNQVKLLQAQITELETQLISEKANINQKYQKQVESVDEHCKDGVYIVKEEIEQLGKYYEALKDQLRKVQNAKRDNESQSTAKQQKGIRLQDQKEELKQEYFWHKDKKIEENCFNCGQVLPENMVEKSHSKKNQKLAELIEKGKEIDSQISELQSEIAELESTISEQSKLISEIETKISETEIDKYELDKKIEQLTENRASKTAQINEKRDRAISDVSEQIKSQITAIYEQIQALTSKQAESQPDTTEIDTEIAKLEELLQKSRNCETAKSRIVELEKQSREIAKQLDRVERIKYLLELRQKTYIGIIETELNSKFQFARFQMFEKLVKDDTSYREVCEILYKGRQDMSTGESMLVGIDICNAFSNNWNIDTPLLIDSGQDITLNFETDKQYLKCLTTTDKQLTIEEV